MSRQTMVIDEPDGFVVGCFAEDCTAGAEGPWISEHETRNAAVKAANRHRIEDREARARAAGTCPTCRRVL